MTDKELKDAASAELKQTTLGWSKVKNYTPEKLAGTHWGKGLALLGQISAANDAPRDQAIVYLKKTTKGYSPTATNWKLAFAELAKIKDPVPSEWTQVAVEDAPFTLTETKEVRYGKGTAWTWKVMGPGTYRCDNATFGDPAVTVVKVCEARATIEEPPPPPPPTPPSGGKWGLTSSEQSASNTFDADSAQRVGARLVRVEIGIGAPASSLDGSIDTYGARGIKVQPLAGFHGRLPSTSEAQNLRNWALRHGPQGTNKISLIEFGNETAGGHYYPGQDRDARARGYAARFKEAAVALQGTGVGLLAEADEWLMGPGWLDNIFATVPEFLSYVAGWVIHPYGPNWGPSKIDTAKSHLAQKGDTSKPFYFTEFGIASDNGRMLDDNFEWPRDLTYQQAADVLAQTETMWVQKLGSRWAQTMIYQVRDQANPGAEIGREHYFGVQQHNGTSDKGAYTAAVRARYAA